MALHLWALIERGKIGLIEEPITATLENFNIKIKGKGGHTGYPENAVDPIITAANIIQTIQIIQTREISSLKPTIIMFTKILSGIKPNIIPDEISLEGTMRYLYIRGGKNNQEELEKKFERIVKAICRAYRADYELKFNIEDNVVINDSDITELVRSTAEKVLGSSKRVIPYMCTASEDFSEFADRVPSVLYFVGAGSKEKEFHYPHHSPRFNIDEDACQLELKYMLK